MQRVRRSLRGLSLAVVVFVLLTACEQSLGLRQLAPDDGAVISCSSVDAGTVRFVWTPVAAAQSYTLVVYDGSGQQFLTRTTGETSVELQLPCGASYSWQVAANPGGTSYWSPRRRFTLTGETFSLITPRNGEVIWCQTPNTIRFTWTQVRDVQHYNLVVRNSAEQLVVSEQVSPGAAAQFVLPCGDTYRWQVIAVKQSPNPPVESPVWTFRVTEAPGGGPAPQLVSPPDGSTVECRAPDNGQVNFDWTDVANATSYTLEVYRASDNSLFLSRTVTASQTTETVVCRPELALQYRWRVGAHVGGNIAWSNFATFTMTVERPFLVSPPDGSTVSVSLPGCAGANSVLFTWTVVLNATSYRVDVFNDATGVLVGSTVVSGATTTTAPVSWSAPACATYRWRVTAIKTAPNPPVSSDEWRFTTAP